MATSDYRITTEDLNEYGRKNTVQKRQAGRQAGISVSGQKVWDDQESNLGPLGRCV